MSWKLYKITKMNKFVIVFIVANIIFLNKIAKAQDHSSLAISLAVFDVIQHHETSIEGRVEYRLNKSNWKLNPFVGVMGNSDEAKFIYMGFFSEFIFFKNFCFSTSTAPGLYFRGKSKDLSFILEFRSQVEISYRFKNSMKIGVSLNHISNISIKPPNIGVESLALTFVIPID